MFSQHSHPHVKFFTLSQWCCFLLLWIGISSVPTMLAAAEVGESSHDHHAHDHDHNHSSEATGTSAEPQSLLKTLGVYSVMIAGASLLGGWLPSRIQFSHLSFQCLLSVVGGMLLGIGVFHLLPHAIHELGQERTDMALEWMMGGIVAMFFLLRMFHVHHHEPPALAESDELEEGEPSHEGCSHEHHAHHPGSLSLSWAGMFLGLSIHTLLDGLALGASMQADSHHGSAWLGVGVLAGIVLHKPLDSLSFTTLMIQSNQSWFRRTVVNVVYSLLCPLGAALFLFGVWSVGDTTFIVGASLAFSAGVFLCIALADLLPEMEFHAHHRWRLSFFLFVGIALAWGLRFLEPAHLHH